jgi:hypothetical protein
MPISAYMYALSVTRDRGPSAIANAVHMYMYNMPHIRICQVPSNMWCTCTCMICYTCVYAYTERNLALYMHTYTYMHTQRIYVYAYTERNLALYMYTYTYMHTQSVHTYMHTQSAISHCICIHIRICIYNMPYIRMCIHRAQYETRDRSPSATYSPAAAGRARGSSAPATYKDTDKNTYKDTYKDATYKDTYKDATYKDTYQDTGHVAHQGYFRYNEQYVSHQAGLLYMCPYTSLVCLYMCPYMSFCASSRSSIHVSLCVSLACPYVCPSKSLYASSRSSTYVSCLSPHICQGKRRQSTRGDLRT